MGQMKLSSAVIAAMVAAFVLAACGGDDSPEQPIVIPTESSTTGSLDKEDFIAEADAICAEANAAINEFADAGQGLTAASEIADLRQSVIDDLEALGPPEDDRATLDEFLTAMEGQVEAGEKIGLALERQSDTTEFETELQTAKDEAATAASSYGFEECGQEVTSTSTGSSATDAGSSAAPVTPAPVTPAPVTPAPVTPAPSEGGVPDSSGGGTGGDTGGGGGVSPGGGISP
jgi:hypothetical protein